MARRMIVTALLSMVVTGCAATEPGVGLTGLTASSESAARLSGTWQGWFHEPGRGGGGSQLHDGNLALQINDDLTFTEALTSLGSGGGRRQVSGTVKVEGNRVILQSPSNGSVTLSRSGNALHGGTRSLWPGAIIAMQLERVETESAASVTQQTVRRRLCEAAGGTHSGHTCQPMTNTALAARCVARGGVYFAGGDYCEVPGGGLRP